MILQTEEFRTACQSILFAIDTKNVSLYNETLELIAKGDTLSMNVTNREYFVTVRFKLQEEENFKASVNAALFLSLISKITSPQIEISIEDANIKIKGNGTYKLALIYNNKEMLELPEININNVTNEMVIPSEILQSILQFNSKELQRGIATKPVQKYYYVDENGCITFTSGACVNSFTLEKPLKILLSEKVVKLFKLFKDEDNVKFTLGHDKLTDDIIQTKVRFEVDNVCLTAILADTGLVNSVPVPAIRGMATKEYPYSIVVHREELLEAISRLMLFNENNDYGKFEFSNGSITITDWSSENKESIQINNDCPALDEYSALMRMSNLELILKGCEDEYVTISLGDSRAVVIKKKSIVDILPEIKEN